MSMPTQQIVRSPTDSRPAHLCLGRGGAAGGARRAACSRRSVTMKSTGKFLVGGNWKCNGSLDSIKTLVAELNGASVPSDVEVVVAPTFIHLSAVVKGIDQTKYQVSAQNCWSRGTGAFTGEIAPSQLKDLGVKWVILGHSERRALLGESDKLVGEKAANALEHGLKVIACIGETLEERQYNHILEVLDRQLAGLASHVSQWENVAIAYEPVWAIGTGKVASPMQVEDVHSFIRNWFSEHVSASVASAIRIIYGGSVTDKNAAQLAGEKDVDGFLVGGASLSGSSFATICNAKAAA